MNFKKGLLDMFCVLFLFLFLKKNLCEDELTPTGVLNQLIDGNQNYVAARGIIGDISSKRRLDVARVCLNRFLYFNRKVNIQ
jgi:hypothetical protein